MRTRPTTPLAYAAALIFVAGVSVAAKPKKEVITWDRDSNRSIVAFHKSVVQMNDINYSLCELGRGLFFFERGDYLHSDARFANAIRLMERIGGEGGRAVAAVALDERAKTFKGEPYERATAHFFRGVCHFNRADYPGALAAFRSSLASDAETRNKETRYLEDFVISHFMAALCYERLNEPENAKAALAMAKKTAPDNKFLSQMALNSNFIAILGIGRGPFKTGPRAFGTGPSPENKVEVTIGKGSPKPSADATDLLVQAKSQTWGSADTARIARKTGKIILSAAIKATTGVDVSDALEDKPDLRSWHGLPLHFYVFAADVPPGNHTVTVKCFDAKGAEIETDRHIWFDVPVPAANGPVFYLPIRQCWQNHHGLERVKITR